MGSLCSMYIGHKICKSTENVSNTEICLTSPSKPQIIDDLQQSYEQYKTKKVLERHKKCTDQMKKKYGYPKSSEKRE